MLVMLSSLPTATLKKKKSTPPHLPQTHCSLQSYALCPHLTPEVVFTNYINNLRNILSVDLICNITFTATLDITKIKICFFSGFYIFLNVIFFWTISLLFSCFSRENVKLQDVQHNFICLYLFSTPINNIIRFASHAVTMHHMEDGILEQSILKPIFETVDISGIWLLQ